MPLLTELDLVLDLVLQRCRAHGAAISQWTSHRDGFSVNHMKPNRRQILQIIFGLLGLVVCQLCYAGPVSEPTLIGAWSEPTNGLKGRLVFFESTTNEHGRRDGIVYLEIQNLALGDNVYVYYDAKKTPLKCELHDSAGMTVKNYSAIDPDWRPSACWLALPNDSSMRFRTGFTAGAPDSPGLFIMSAFDGGKWLIPATATNDYFLSGTFSATHPTNETHERVWEGALRLPPVRIPARGP